MKQLLLVEPLFNPTAKTLDFYLVPNFSIDKLYGVINITRNQILYAPGATGLGLSSIGLGLLGTQTLITLQWDTSSYSTSDELNIYYDADPGYLSNTPMEMGGMLQKIAETENQILAELKLMNFILAQGLNIQDDIERLRNDVNTPGNIPGIN